MSHTAPPTHEVTRALSDCARAAGFRFGEDTAVVAVQHMLEQTVVLFKAAACMGLNLRNVFALGKVYSNSLPVIERLRGLGVTVLESTVPPPGEFNRYCQSETNRLWQIVAKALPGRRIKRLLVLDDGGVCITSVPPEILKQYDVCGVEQTSLGTFLFEEKPPAITVFSWARTAVKLQIGGPIFSQCFIERFRRDFLRGGSLHGAQLGIIGMGSIGKALANLAAREGDRLSYYDPIPDALVPASLRDKVTRVNSLEELMLRCDYVVGCSGRNPFKGNWPLSYKPGIKLLSASGGDQEFGPIINDLRHKPDFKITPKSWDITCKQGPSGPIQIAYLGYPYNFVSRATEAVPTAIVQIEIGGLLAALMQARLYLELTETTRQQNSGIQRTAPSAQRFIYYTWLNAMADRRIDVIDLFGYDPAMLNVMSDDEWFIQNTQPKQGAHYTPIHQLEEMMDYIFSVCTVSRLLEGKAESNLCALGTG